MRDKRALKFGYILRNGDVHPHPDEAPVVEQIYIQYANGASYIQITSMLNAGTVFYHDSGNPWNKNMVARIIGNKIYIGANGYPKLIADDLFKRATDRKPDTGRSRDANAKVIRALCKCETCGSKAVLLSNQRAWGRWSCPTCGLLAKGVTLPYVTASLEELITEMKRRSEIVRAIPQENGAQTHVQALEQCLQEAMEQEQFDEDHARRLVMQLAQARMEAIGAEEHEAMRIRRLLLSSNKNGESTMELFPKITSAILIPISGEISLLLKNGQTIGRSDFEWQ